MSARWVIGRHSVLEVFRVRPRDIAEIWIADRTNDFRKTSFSEELKSFLEKSRPAPTYVAEKKILQHGSGHQGIAVRVQSQPELDWQELEDSKTALILLLDEISDPQNLGAILRTAWLSKAQGVLVTDHRSADVTPTVAKVASGGAEHVPVESAGNLTQAITRLKEIGFWVYGLDGGGKSFLWQQDLTGKVAIVVGSEESGMRQSVRGLCDEIVKLPMLSLQASFNAAHSVTMALYEIQRQRLFQTK